MSFEVTAKSLEPVLRAMSSKGLLSDRAPSADVFDLDYFEARIDSLRRAFPEKHFLHAVALKVHRYSNPWTIFCCSGTRVRICSGRRV